jgi:hypothetical protein
MAVLSAPAVIGGTIPSTHPAIANHGCCFRVSM